MIVASVPEAEHVFITQKLLKTPKHEKADIVRIMTNITNGLEQTGVNNDLSRVEHFPPMRKPVLRERLALVSHMAERNFASRPKLFQVGFFALVPFGICGIKAR